MKGRRNYLRRLVQNFGSFSVKRSFVLLSFQSRTSHTGELAKTREESSEFIFIFLWGI